MPLNISYIPVYTLPSRLSSKAVITGFWALPVKAVKLQRRSSCLAYMVVSLKQNNYLTALFKGCIHGPDSLTGYSSVEASVIHFLLLLKPVFCNELA